MPNTLSLMTTRLQSEVPSTEAKVDDAIIALASLMATVVTARRETNVPANTGQQTILRLAKAQMSLVGVSNDVLRVHGELLDIGREKAGYDIRDCPPASGEVTRHLAAVA